MFKRKDRESFIVEYKGYSLFFKIFLIFGVLVIAAVFLYFTQDIVTKLKEDSRRVVAAYSRLWQIAASESAEKEEVSFLLEEVIQRADFPLIVTGPEGEPQAWKGVPGIASDDTTFASRQKLKEIAKKLDEDHLPVPIFYGKEDFIISYLHYGDPEIIARLHLMPIVEVGVIALFILITFISFRNIKKSEQHSIWIGMAKETAHQLGTPISSLMGWLELLKQEQYGHPTGNLKETVSKMEEDLHRLEKIAHRFSQIGSIPELKETDLNSIIEEVVKYFRNRLPHAGSGVCIKTDLKPVPLLKINAELVSWVIENLIKNALESVDPKQGVIEISTAANSKLVTLTISDNGKGIPTKEQKRVFHPGYTTKKRGWGLGLSLAKRIVEDYHQGKIVLEESIPNQKNVFIVSFPIA